MDRTKKRIKWTGMVLAVLLAGCMFSASVYAQDYESGRKGSITLELDDIGTEYAGTEFSCTKIADVDTETTVLKWKLIEELQDISVDLQGLQSAGEYQKAAEQIEEAVQNRNLTKTIKQADENGRVIFDDLEQGVYLLAQTDTAEYGTTDTFLAAVPYTSQGTEWVYDVVTQTKGEHLPKEQPTPTPMPEQDKEEPVKPSGAKTGDDTPVMTLGAVLIVSAAALLIIGTHGIPAEKKD